MPDTDDTLNDPVKPSLLNRRGVLSLLVLSGAGLMAGTQSSHAFLDFLSSFSSASPGTLKRLNIPLEWQKGLGSQLPNYAEYLHKIHLKYATVRQIIEPHTNVRGKVSNSLPPRSLWGNIRSTLRVVDSLADRLDLSVEDIVSVYRSPAYNARCFGAKSNSYHLRNNAMDIIFPCPPGKVAAMARAMKSAGIFKGGVGRYGNFTHVDTRGQSVDW